MDTDDACVSMYELAVSNVGRSGGAGRLVVADGVEEDTENVGDVEVARRLSNGHVAWWSR